MNLSKKISVMNGMVIVCGFVAMIILTAVLNYRFTTEREKQKMQVVLSNSIRMVDDKLKDMGRVSLICFSDQRGQEILMGYQEYDYKKRLEAVSYLKNLYTSLVTIRNDISGVFMFDLKELVFYQDNYAPSLRLDYNYKKYLQTLTKMEENYRNVANCKVFLDTQPDFLRYSKETMRERGDNYCIYFLRSIKSFSPHTQIGHIMLTSPVKVTGRILEEYLEPHVVYYLTTEDGKIVYASDKELIGKELLHEATALYGKIAQDSGEFREKLNAEEYIFLYEKSSFSGMTLITGVPDGILVGESVEFISKSAAILLLLLIAVVILSGIFTNKLTKPVRNLSSSMASFHFDNLNIRFPVKSKDEAGTLMESFNHMMDIINRLIEQEYESKVRIQEAQLNENKMSLLYLKNQINSHFLYNTLDNIRMKAELDGSFEVSEMIMMLVEFFRLSVRVEEQMVPLEREIRLIKVYLKLMCFRYPMLECVYDIDEMLMECLIPNFILQPIVENSVLHGLKAKGYRGKIVVSVQGDRQKADYLILKIYDNGSGINEENFMRIQELLKNVKEENHIGIANVQKRLKIYYPKETGLSYSNNPEGGVTVTIVMKKQE